MDNIIGIDLGTTNSEVAVIQNGRPVIIPVDGDKILPSVVGREPSTGQLLVGKPARNQYIVHPRHTVRSIKRRMGQREKVFIGNEPYSPEEISAMILRRLKSAAEAYLQAEVKRAVITVPAYFNDLQRRATQQAGEIAGLEVVRILNEPTAAALAHGLTRQEDQICLVYDLGGGTFDVSVVERAGGILEVLASHGNTALGGDDFDQIVLRKLVEEFRQAHGIDLAQDLRALARMTFAAERVKIALSDAPFAQASEEFIVTKDALPLNLIREVSRQELENWIGPLVESTRESLERALADAKISREKIQKVLLVGGSTHMPLVWHVIEETLGQIPHAEVDPALAVALGAAVQAGIIAGEAVDMILVDVAAHSLGIEVLHLWEGLYLPNAFSRIIPRNTAIPARKSEVYVTSYDFQDAANIKIYQGEHEIATENTLLGEFRFEGLTRAPTGQVQILVSFDYDASGMLHVKAQERGTGSTRELTVKTLGTGRDGTEKREAGVHDTAAGQRRVHSAAAASPPLQAPETSRPVAASSQSSPVLARARAVLEREVGENRKKLGEAVVRLEQAMASGSSEVAAREQTVLDILYEID
ncbi:MAG: Hsp70 family protein [Acidobacteria bacterium]|nr:Hsp70 family protein [Acidobacteriota bacterium]